MRLCNNTLVQQFRFFASRATKKERDIRFVSSHAISYAA